MIDIENTRELFNRDDCDYPTRKVVDAIVNNTLGELELTREERDAYRMAAEQLRNMLDQRWISVKDRLPDRGEMCLVWRKHTNEFLAVPFSKHRNSKEWHSVGYGTLTTSVTHWQPLPPAPEAHDAKAD